MIAKLLAAAALALIAAPLFSLHHLPRLEARVAAADTVRAASLACVEPLLPASLF